MVLALDHAGDPVGAESRVVSDKAVVTQSTEAPWLIDKSDKVVLTGAAGLVGQNLAVLLQESGYTNLVGIDKHPYNTSVLRELHPGMSVIEADLSVPGDWARSLTDARAVVMLQAQIGGEVHDAFVANNVRSTERVLAACREHGVDYIVHISSSVLNSRARDFYTDTKKAQEQLVLDSGIPNVVLRPTLMFGWFDRKHLGWLSRFMRRSPVFPIPGSGHYVRQPLYIMDFCRIVRACLERRPMGEMYDISGQEEIAYIDIIRAVKAATGSRTRIVRIPYRVFWLLLKCYALYDRDPPFTTRQLEALVIPETFPLISWGKIFGVRPTPFREAIQQTFADSRFADVVLEF
jgi:nucleoside-diphosphate-sugar epimerase